MERGTSFGSHWANLLADALASTVLPPLTAAPSAKPVTTARPSDPITVGELQRGIARHEFVVHYQPLVDLDTETIVGAEALVRWNHPDRGLLGPDTFLGLAEHSGAIVAIGREVLATVLEDVVSIPELGRLRVSVNLAMEELLTPGFVGSTRDALRRHHVDPGAITFELTETDGGAGPRHAAHVIRSLSSLGVRTAIDDFGKAQSSLARLRHLPVSEIKIDRSLVDHLDRDVSAAAIVRAVVELAETMGLSVIAEGVERREEAAALRALGCRRAQGFLWGRPVPVQTFSAERSVLTAAV